jgi:hypothetical protein
MALGNKLARTASILESATSQYASTNSGKMMTNAKQARANQALVRCIE